MQQNNFRLETTCPAAGAPATRPPGLTLFRRSNRPGKGDGVTATTIGLSQALTGRPGNDDRAEAPLPSNGR